MKNSTGFTNKTEKSGFGFLTLVNRIIWQKPHNCGFFYVKFIKF